MTLDPSGPATLGSAGLALLCTAGLCLIPGYGIVRASSKRLDRMDALAAAPAVGTGLLYALGLAFSALDIPVNGWLGVGAVALGLLGAAISYSRRTQRITDAKTSRWLWGSAALGIVLGAAIWIAGIGNLGAVPSYRDGINHGYFTARVVVTGSLQPSLAMPKDPISGGHVISYYPLALHEMAAMVSQLSGVDVGLAFTMVAICILVVALPLGMVAICRRLYPAWTATAAVAGPLSALAPALTYSTSWWAGYPQAAGLALAAGSLPLLLDAANARIIGVVLGGFALAGLAGVHTSELVLVALVMISLWLRPRDGHDRAWRSQAATFAGLGAPFLVALVLLLPALGQMSAGYADRIHTAAWQYAPASTAVAQAFGLVTAGAPTTPAAVVAAFLLGAVIVLVTRKALAWFALWAAFAAIYVWLLAFPSQTVFRLTSFWYSVPWRLAYVSVFLAIPLVAVAVGAPVDLWLRRRRNRTPLSAALLAIGVALAVSIPATVIAPSISAINGNYRTYSLVDSDARAAFTYLSGHVHPGSRVLNEHQDGSPWMYGLDGVVPLIALRPDLPVLRSWTDRNYVVSHAANALTDPREQQLLRAFRIEYAYVGARVFPGDKKFLDATTMIQSGAWTVVFARGDSIVLKRTNV